MEYQCVLQRRRNLGHGCVGEEDGFLRDCLERGCPIKTRLEAMHSQSITLHPRDAEPKLRYWPTVVNLTLKASAM